MSAPVQIRFLGFEQRDPWRLSATFDVVDGSGAHFIAHALLDGDGRVHDLQASDSGHIATTGRPEVDDMVRRRVAAELVRCRSAAVVAAFDARRERGRRTG